MRRYALLLAALASVVALGADKGSDRSDYFESFQFWRSSLVRRRLYQTRPVRREHPLRELGPSAVEIEQMQAAAATVIPKTMIYIGPVVTGCPCENGPKCTAEVWVYGYAPGRIEGLLLSRVGDVWTVGVVQSWWLELRRLEMKDTGYRELWEYEENFPACESELRRMYEERYATRRKT